MQRLLEGRFHDPALHIDGLYSASVGDALRSYKLPSFGGLW
jgi:hypothetical protein